MWICINHGKITPLTNGEGNKLCPICGLLAIKTDKEDIGI